MLLAEIKGTGVGLPEKIATNNELAEFLDTSDEWIAERTGIRERRIAAKETLTELCERAALQAMERAGVTAKELDTIIVATLTADNPLPNASSCLQKALGADNAVCYDISAACSGFIFALNIARLHIQCGDEKNILVVGGEILSKIMDWTDRSTCILFGDGVGAAVVGAAEDGKGILAVDLGSNGAKGHVLRMEGRPIANPFRETTEDLTKKRYVQMEGQEVFKFAVSQVPISIRKILEKTGKTVGDVDWFVLHQANMRIIKSVAKRLKAPDEKFVLNMQRYGNTSAASVPIVLDEAIQNGMVKKGDLVVLSGFGGGLTWGSMLIQM